MDGELSAIERQGTRVVCGAGARLPSATAQAARWGLTGLEFGINIPGTVGGAVRMNANAYGGQLARVLEWARVCSADGVEQRSGLGADVAAEGRVDLLVDGATTEEGADCPHPTGGIERRRAT